MAVILSQLGRKGTWQGKANRECNSANCITKEGAKVPLRLAFGDIGDTTGVYWANEEIWQKGEGALRVWSERDEWRLSGSGWSMMQR